MDEEEDEDKVGRLDARLLPAAENDDDDDEAPPAGAPAPPLSVVPVVCVVDVLFDRFADVSVKSKLCDKDDPSSGELLVNSVNGASSLPTLPVQARAAGPVPAEVEDCGLGAFLASSSVLLVLF